MLLCNSSMRCSSHPESSALPSAAAAQPLALDLDADLRTDLLAAYLDYESAPAECTAAQAYEWTE